MERYTAQRGQVLPLVALLIVVLMGFTAFAVDVGFHRYAQRVEQSAADSAALAGAQDLGFGSTYWKASARNDASQNGFTDDGGGASCTRCVFVNNPPASGPFSGNANAVEVIVSAAQPTFFERVFSISSVRVHARAVAMLDSNNNACLYMLSPTSNDNFNGSTVNAPGCSIMDNGSMNLNSSTVTAAGIEVSGGTGGTGGTFPQATPAPLPIPVSDPCNQIPGCEYLANNAPSTTPCSTGTVSGGYAIPGCYSALTLSGTVTMNPGVYVINGAFDASKATVTGTNVTFYITNNGTLNLNQATLNLSAPTSGSTANVLFYQVPSNTNAPNFDKTTNMAFSGLLYFPSSSVNLNKSFGNYTVMVFGSVNFNKNSTINLTGPAANSSIIKNTYLAE